MKRFLFLLSVIFVSALAYAGSNVPPMSGYADGRRAVIVQKNFELCWLLSSKQKISARMTADPVLSEITGRMHSLFQKAENDDEALRGLLFSADEIAQIGDRLSALSSLKEVKALCADLRKNGKYFIYNDLSDNEFIKEAWAQDAGGINKIISVYGLEEKPKYKIDIPNPNLHEVPFYEKNMPKHIRPIIRETALEFTQNGMFFNLPLEVALKYLDINNRYEAADFEPLEKTINAVSSAAVRSTKWKNYPYSAILVPGSGPQAHGEKISPKCRVRCAHAAELYLQGVAPFIILSGGRAHPAMTEISEAEEMKRYMMDNYGIPEKALIAEPHARHTTTNIRNAVRIMLRCGFPSEKPVLITSTSDQLDSIEGKSFEKRCLKEMYVYPCVMGQRTGKYTLEFMMLPSAMQINPLDPLDP